jgi:hypothetical protein
LIGQFSTEPNAETAAAIAAELAAETLVVE